MNKNPFSLYDFLGYLFPGMISVLLLLYAPSIIECNFNIKEIKSIFVSDDYINWLNLTGLLVIVSYVTGHIVAYLSSLTVEFFSNKIFGYPSMYLLNINTEEDQTLYSKYYKGSSFTLGLMKFIVSLCLFPIAIFFFFMKRNCTLVYFIARPLEPYIRNNIRTRLYNLTEHLGLSSLDVNSREDYHRIVMHYVYNNVSGCQKKIDNYVAIYGFLRAVTFISCIFFDYTCVNEIISIFKRNEYSTFNFTAVFALLSLFILSIILYMAFVKFYRRFTLENYMTLLTEVNNVDHR